MIRYMHEGPRTRFKLENIFNVFQKLYPDFTIFGRAQKG